MIEYWERLARAVWPPPEVEDVAGFSCAFADGYSKRANSALASAVGSSAQSWSERIRAVEDHYAAKGFPAIFKMSAASPRALEDELIARGYALVDPTSVSFRAPGRLPSGRACPGKVALRIEGEVEAQGADWLESVRALGGVSDAHLPAFQKIAGAMPFPRAFSALREEASERVLAIGIGIVAGEALHLCEIATVPAARRRGLAHHLVCCLIEWGEEQGATRTWLQRVVANTPAAALYREFDFREHYRHWYRVSC